MGDPAASARAYLYGSVTSSIGSFDDESNRGRSDSSFSLDVIAAALGLPPPPQFAPARAASAIARASADPRGVFSSLCDRYRVRARHVARLVADVETSPPVTPIGVWHRVLAAIRVDELVRASPPAAPPLDAMRKVVDNGTARAAHEAETAGVIAANIEAACARVAASASVAGAAAGGAPAPRPPPLWRAPVPVAVARQTLAVLVPTATPETEKVAVSADASFAKLMKKFAESRPDQMHRLLRRHVFCVSRIPRGVAWRPPSLGEMLPKGGESSAGADSVMEKKRGGGAGGGRAADSATPLATPVTPLVTPVVAMGVSRALSGGDALDVVAMGVSRAQSGGDALDVTEAEVTETVRRIAIVSGNHSIGAKLAVWAGAFGRLYAQAVEAGSSSLPSVELAGAMVAAISPRDGGEGGGSDAPRRSSSVVEGGDGVSAAAGHLTSTRLTAPRATLLAAISDLRTFAALFARGFLVKYAWLREIPVDVSASLTSAVTEALHVIAHDTLFAIIGAHTAAPDALAIAAVRRAAALPPCAFGLSHMFCTENEAGCCGADATTAALPPSGEAAALASQLYAPAIEAFSHLPAQRTPLGKLSVLRIGLAAIAHCVLIERRLGEVGDEASATPACRAFTSSQSPARPKSPAWVTTALSPGSNTSIRAAAAQNQPQSPTFSTTFRHSGGGGGSQGGGAASPTLSPMSSGSAVGADELMPRICFVLARAWGTVDVRPIAQLTFLEECLPEDRALGEDGYAVVSLRGALQHAIALGDELGRAEAKSARKQESGRRSTASDRWGQLTDAVDAAVDDTLAAVAVQAPFVLSQEPGSPGVFNC